MIARSVSRQSATVALTTALLAAALAAPATAVDDAGDDATSPFIGELPKSLRSVGDFRWLADPAESQLPGSNQPGWADFDGVGLFVGEGPVNVRDKTIKQRNKKNNGVGNEADSAKGKPLVWAVFNLVDKPPKKSKTDLVAWVGGVGPDSVPWDPTVQDSMTEGTSSVSLMGLYGSQPKRPWLSGDDSTQGDAPGGTVDFDLPGTGAGGYDPKTNSIWTSFVPPDGTEFLTFGLYTTAGGFQTDLLGGLGHTYRVPMIPAAYDFECAEVEVYPRTNQAGVHTGLTDIKLSLVMPSDGVMSSSDAQPVLGFNNGGPGSGEVPVEADPASPPGSGITFWNATVPSGDTSIFDPTAPAWDSPADAPPPAAATAFGNVRVNGAGDSGTAFGHSRCGDVLHFEGCAPGGGVDFWAGVSERVAPAGAPGFGGSLVEVPFELPNHSPFCVLAEEGGTGALAVFGVQPRPYTIESYSNGLESNPCNPQPIDLGFGGVKSVCDDGTMSLVWLQSAKEPGPGVDPGWGFKFEATVLPDGQAALGIDPETWVPSAEVRDYVYEEARLLLEEAGWTMGPDGTWDFRAVPNGN